MFEGAKILVVEDNCLFAEVVCAFVADCGMRPIGPAARLERGMVFAHEAPLDGAILDIDLDGQRSFPICTALLRRGIPFCFLTGCSDLSRIPAQFRSMPVVSKPFEDNEMRCVIEAMLAGKLGSPPMHATSTPIKTSTLPL
jgi:DNA-binding response OmpR family regulator